MRAAAAIVAMEIRRLLRDRVALFFIVVLPLAIILLVGTTVADDDGVSIGIAGPTDGSAAALVERLDETFDLHSYASADELRGALREEIVVAGIVVPDDLEMQIAQGSTAQIEVLTAPSGGAGAGSVVSAVRSAADAESIALSAAAFAAAETGSPFRRALETARDVGTVDLADSVEQRVIGSDVRDPVDDLPSGFDYTAPRNLVLFIFITSLAASGTFIQMRQLGIAKRALAAPVSATTLLLGVAASRFAIALVQAVVIVVAGAIVFGVSWGDPLAATLVIVSFALVGTGIGMLGGTVFRTSDQASAIGPPVGIMLGMLGGCMWPLEIVPPVMRTIGKLTPHAWAVDAFTDLMGRGRGLVAVLPEIGVLLGFAVVLLTLSTFRVRRSLAT